MFRVAVPCANLFHEEVEGGEAPLITTSRTVETRDELDELLGRKVQVHGRCYCGHVTAVTVANAVLVEHADTETEADTGEPDIAIGADADA